MYRFNYNSLNPPKFCVDALSTQGILVTIKRIDVVLIFVHNSPAESISNIGSDIQSIQPYDVLSKYTMFSPSTFAFIPHSEYFEIEVQMYTKALMLFMFIDLLFVFAVPYRIMTQKEIFCGSRLRETMTRLCDGKYVDRQMKRTGGHYLDFGEELENQLEDMDDELTERELEQSLIPLKIRKGIVDECCRKPCSEAYLKNNYCG
ncbi:hypothetical protein JTB14_021716 [Gonioctena quinquepunctata]|nr:hypothetical protein JTB14_021716 [Gonioctena quinquepunctata]